MLFVSSLFHKHFCLRQIRECYHYYSKSRFCNNLLLSSPLCLILFLKLFLGILSCGVLSTHGILAGITTFIICRWRWMGEFKVYSWNTILMFELGCFLMMRGTMNISIIFASDKRMLWYHYYSKFRCYNNLFIVQQPSLPCIVSQALPGYSLAPECGCDTPL